MGVDSELPECKPMLPEDTGRTVTQDDGIIQDEEHKNV